MFVCGEARAGARTDQEASTSDARRGGRGRTEREPKWVAAGRVSLPGGGCIDGDRGCALHLCAAPEPQREHSSDQDYRDSAGAVC